MEHQHQNNESLAPAKKIIGRKRVYVIPCDPVYSSIYVTALTNKIMRQGKKSIAYKIVLEALEILGQHAENPVELLTSALSHTRPSVELKSSASSYFPVPTEIRAPRAFSLSLKFIINAAKKNPKQPFSKRLARIILDAANGKGEAIAMKDSMHASAAANNAFKI